MNYLKESKKPLATQDEEQRTISVEMFEGALELAHTGNTCDQIKRTIFYKDTEAGERYTDNLNKISDLGDNLTMADTLLDQDMTDMFHAVLGIGSEAGEIAEAFLKMLTTGEVDKANMKEEIGDVLWYMAIICRRFNFTFEDAMVANNAKLAKRYKDGKFSCKSAKNRDLGAERKILEKR